MARTQAKNYDEVRQLILTRSAEVFAERGYAAASIADLARANGVSKGNLYHYFASKEALLEEMLNDHLDMMVDAVGTAAKRGETPEARFRSAVTEFVRINAASRALQIVLLHDLQHLGEDQRAVIVGKQRRILAIVKDLIAALLPEPVPEAELTARTMMFVGSVNYTYVWYDPDGPVGPDAYAEMAANGFLKGVRG